MMRKKGHKIIEGLRQAVNGDFARVTIEGQIWERVEPPVPIRGWSECSQTVDNDTSAVEFVDWLKGLIEKIPEELRPEARMSVRALLHLQGGYQVPGGPSLSVFIGIGNPTDKLARMGDLVKAAEPSHD